MKGLFLFCSLLFAPLLLAKDSSHLFHFSSEKAFFDGKCFSLKGKISLFAENFGKIEAKSAQFQKTDDDLLPEILLEGEVNLLLSNGAKLSCDKVRIDQKKKTLFFFSHSSLTFTSPTKEGALTVTAKRASCQLSPSFSLPKASAKEIVTFSFEDDLSILLSPYLTLHGGKLVYEAKKGEENLSGILFLFPQKDKLCTLFFHKEKIEADSVQYDVEKALLTFFNPFGNIFSLPQRKEMDLTFSAKKLLWDFSKKSWRLLEKAYLQEKNFRVTSDEIAIENLFFENFSFQTIKLVGSSEITFLHSPYRLQCTGAVALDPTNRVITAFAASFAYPLLFAEEKKNALFALHAKLFYEEEERGHFTPSALYLHEDVCLVLTEEGEKELFSHVGFAEELVYFPKKKILKLSGKNRKRVLFADERGTIALSADEIVIHPSTQNKSAEVQGKGDVRCSFSLKEKIHFRRLRKKYLERL